MTQGPWEILQLSADEASSQDVRRAYARLLKLHRPDHDPEGFRRVHAAYEAALAELAGEVQLHRGAPAPVPYPGAKWEPGSWDTEIEEDTFSHSGPVFLTTDDSQSNSSAKKALLTALDDLSGKLSKSANLDIQEHKEIENEKLSIEQIIEIHPELTKIWSLRMAQIVSWTPSWFIPSFSALLRELRGGLNGAILALIWRADDRGEVDLLEFLHTEILAVRRSLRGEHAIEVFVALACAMAAWDLPGASELIDLVGLDFGLSHPNSADLYDQAKRLSRLLAGMPHESKKFWKRRLLKNDAASLDWRKNPECREQLETLRSSQAKSWPGRDDIAALLPFPLKSGKIPRSRSSQRRLAALRFRVGLIIVLILAGWGLFCFQRWVSPDSSPSIFFSSKGSSAPGGPLGPKWKVQILREELKEKIRSEELDQYMHIQARDLPPSAPLPASDREGR